MPSGPYPPMVWGLGGVPERSVDIPITSVFLALFICGAAVHMTIFQLNNRKGHKFLFSVMLFGFCMARTVTCILRIASVSLPHNLNLAIAAQVFVAAGVVLIYIINLLFAQRIIRAQHPRLGWHRLLSLAFKALWVLIVLTLIMLITSVIQSFFTLDAHTRRIDRAIQLYGATFYAIVAFLPIPLVLLGLVLPRRTRVEKFGSGRFRTKIGILLLATATICAGAAFRCGTSWKTPVPRSRPMPGYYSKACFYIFNFTIEVVVVYAYAILRIDRRFHVPNGARGAGSYSAKPAEARVYSEEETFEDRPQTGGEGGDLEAADEDAKEEADGASRKDSDSAVRV